MVPYLCNLRSSVGYQISTRYLNRVTDRTGRSFVEHYWQTEVFDKVLACIAYYLRSVISFFSYSIAKSSLCLV